MGVSQGGRGGTVVQTSSICGLWSGVMPQDGHVEHVYTAAKFGLIGLTRYWNMMTNSFLSWQLYFLGSQQSFR